MGVGRRRRVMRDWAMVFEEFAQSGLAIREFCRVKGISLSIFYKHRKNYIGADSSNRQLSHRGDFVELQRALPTPARRSASITFGNQIELSISNDCDKELLRLLISQLKSPSC